MHSVVLTPPVCTCPVLLLPCSALDPRQAALDVNGECVAVEDAEGARHLTDVSIDMVQTALCVVQVIAGRHACRSALPAAVNPDCYDLDAHEEEEGEGQSPADGQAKPGRHAFFKAVREFSWPAWAQAEALPDDARGFILWCLDPDPRKRPRTGAEALQHPFLAAAVGKLQQMAAAAAEEYSAADMQLQKLLSPDDARMMSVGDAVEAAMVAGSCTTGEAGAGRSSCSPDSSTSNIVSATAFTTAATATITTTTSSSICMVWYATPLQPARSCSTDVKLPADACCGSSSHSTNSGSSTHAALIPIKTCPHLRNKPTPNSAANSGTS